MVLEDKKLLAKNMLRQDFVSVQQGATVEQALNKFRNFKSKVDKPSVYYVYVLEDSVLKGVVSVNDLLGAEGDRKVEGVMEEQVVAVKPESNLEKVARKMAAYDYQAIPIVENSQIKGVIRLDEMLEVLDNEATEDIFKKAGIMEEVDRSRKVIDASILQAVRIRIPWLLFALGGGLLAGGVIEFFESSLQTVVALAFFIPVIMDMGGNVGTQSSTIFVRGLVLGSIESDKAVRHLVKEAATGLIIGVITGFLAALAAYVWHGSFMVSTVLFLSMALTCAFASVLGYIIPWTAHKLGSDPAAVSDPMITTIKDITALLIYFGLATVLLGI